MRHPLIGTAVAALLAAPLAAQTPRPAASPARSSSGQPAYQHQLVTVEGCVQRERAPADVALDLSADPESRLMFLLTNAEVRSRIDTMPGDAGAGTREPVPGPADIQNERAGVPATGPAATAGAQDSTRKEGPALEGSATPAAETYVIVGLEDDRLRLFAGQRVAMTGQFEPPAASAGPDEAAAPNARTRGAREPAPQDAPPAIGTTGTTAAPAGLPRFRAASIKPVPGICAPKP